MAKVYAPARAESYDSNSTSPKFTPTSSEGSSGSAFCNEQLKPNFNSQPRMSPRVSHSNFPYHRNPTFSHMMTAPNYNLSNGVQFNTISPQQAILQSSFGQYPAYSIPPRPTYPGGYVSSPVFPPFMPYGSSGVQSHQPYLIQSSGTTPQSPLPSAQLQFEAQTEDNVKRIMANKIVDELMKLNLDRDQVLSTGAALLSGLKSSETTRLDDPRPIPSDTPLSVDRKHDQRTDMNNNNLDCNNGENWGATTNVHNGWNAGSANTDWASSSNPEASTEYNFGPLTSNLPKPAATCTADDLVSESSQHDWESNNRSSEEYNGGWNDYDPDESADTDVQSTDESLHQPADQFEDPFRTLVTVFDDKDKLVAELYVPVYTLRKLFHHVDFRTYPNKLYENRDLRLPAVAGFNVEAIKQILHLLETDAKKQEAICYSAIEPHLRADMYTIAIGFHLDIIAQYLLSAMSWFQSPLTEFVAFFTALYNKVGDDMHLREHFKSDLRNQIVETCQYWGYSRVKEEERLQHFKSALSTIENQNMKADLLEVLLDKVTSDALANISKEACMHDDFIGEPEYMSGQSADVFQEEDEGSCQDCWDDGYDSHTDNQWEASSGRDDQIPLRAPTPENPSVDNWNGQVYDGGW